MRHPTLLLRCLASLSLSLSLSLWWVLLPTVVRRSATGRRLAAVCTARLSRRRWRRRRPLQGGSMQFVLVAMRMEEGTDPLERGAQQRA